MPRSKANERMIAATTVVAACGGAGTAWAQQATFNDIGVLPQGAYSIGAGVSRDGKTAVGLCLVQPGGTRAVLWNAGNLRNLGVVSGGDLSAATGVSANGSVVAGYSTTSNGLHPFRWQSPGPMVAIGTPTQFGQARGISGNGDVVVGDSPSFASSGRAFRWTAAGGMVSLGTIAGGETGNSVAYAANADGTIVVGQSTYSTNIATAHAFRFNANGSGSLEDLGALPDQPSSQAFGVNGDGTIVVGDSGTGSVEHPFLWRQGMLMQDLGTLPGSARAYATAVSDDGRVVVGNAGFSASDRAFLWTPTLGMVDLNTYLPEHGVNLDGWVLTQASAVSASGTVIVGSGTLNGALRGWIADLDPDTDGDGLRDSWEIDGVPYTDSNGVLHRVMLPDADPMKKDLYVEVDAMSGFFLTGEAVSYLTNAFANAPVSNPAPSGDGITLHILRDELDLPLIPVWETVDHCWPATFDEVRAAHYGTPQERADPDAEALLAAKAKAYRYCVIASQAGPDNIGGCGNLPGDNFVMYLGSSVYDPIDQAAVFMHELGHNLGLHHGGGDDINGKPNYPSIMNYALSYQWYWDYEFWQLDYSRAALADLNELSLNERAGIGTPSGLYHNYWMPFGVNSPAGGRSTRFVRLRGRPTDFGDRAGTGFQDGLFDTSVVQDLNFSIMPPPGVRLPSEHSPGQMLRSYNDWANVSLPLAASLGTGAPIPAFPTDELTGEAREWIAQNFPVPPPVCYANCDRSTATPVLNVNDFICFQTAFAAGDSYANCDESTSPPVLNVNDFICFQTAFAAGCP